MSERSSVSSERRTYAALVLDSWDGLRGGSSPLHMTVAPPCMMTDVQMQQFASLLKVDLHEFGAVDVIGGQEDWFGPANTERVRRVARTAELLTLHELVMVALTDIVPCVDITYALGNYQPHVTLKNGSGVFDEGERRRIDRLTVLCKHPDTKLWLAGDTIRLTES